MKFEAVLGRWRRQELDQMEAAEILGMTERTFRRKPALIEVEADLVDPAEAVDDVGARDARPASEWR
jgi:hypothetical protein